MSDPAPETYECRVCAARYAWSRDHAGMIVRCKSCGETITVPGDPDEEIFDVVPSPVQPVKPVAPVRSPADDASTVLPYLRPVTPEADERFSDANPIIASWWKDIVCPALLIAIGTIASFVWAYQSNITNATGAARWFNAAIHVGFGFAFDVFVMLVGIIAAARILSTAFGPIPTAILKLGGIALGPSGVAAIVMWSIGGAFYPLLVGWTFGLVFYFILFWYLFELDPEEVWQTVLIVYGCRIIFGTIWMLIPVK